jgi:cell division protein FtsZ
VIAAGFDGGMPKRREDGSLLRRGVTPSQGQQQGQVQRHNETQAPSQPPVQARTVSVGSAADEPSVTAAGGEVTVDRPTPVAAKSRLPTQFEFDDDDLDVPDFLK